MLPTKALVLRPVGGEARALVAGPDHHVGGRLDLLDLVAVLQLLVAGEIDDLRARRLQRAADREQHRVAEAAARQQHGLARRRLGRRAGRAHQDHRLVRLQPGAELGRSAHLQHDQADQALLHVGPGAGQRQAFHGEARVARLRRQGLEILQAIELAGQEVGGGLRRLDHHFDDGRRQAVDGADLRAQAAVEVAQERGVIGSPGGRQASPGSATPPASRAWRCPSPSPRCRRRTDAGRRRS